MFNFVKKIFVRPVSQSDILVLEMYGKVLTSLEAIKTKMSPGDKMDDLDQKISVARTKFVNQLADMAKRGYVHGQIAN